MRTRNMAKVDSLAKLGVFTAEEARKQVSISQPTLYRLEKDALIEKVARGLFLHPDAEINYEHLDYIIACKTLGSKAVIGGLSALSYYNLIEQVPMNIWLLTPPSKNTVFAIKNQSKNQKYRLIRTKLSLKTEVLKKKQFKIVTLERALIEGLKHESKLGQGLVFGAIQNALNNELTSESKLAKVARKLKLMKILEKKWELLAA